MTEDVRPINWANRPKSYIARTNEWDEYPNGRWGDGRSPAFGELSTHFFGATICTKEDRLAMWGESPLASEEIGEVFVKYIEGKIPMLPWCETALQVETNTIAPLLLEINRKGFWTINSQPSVNGVKSDHSMYGWGGPGGRVYQKSYLEFFTSPTNLQLMINALPHHPSLTLHSIDCQGNLNSMPRGSGGGGRGVAALTWGVFPDKEILQPTIFDPDTFVVWSKEAFQLWVEAWAVLYEDETDSAELIHNIHDTYLLVAIIDNDFIDSDMYAIFRQVMRDIESDKQANPSHEDDQTIGLVL
jgi:methylenetetrahydrofolate reductase (NADPH)